MSQTVQERNKALVLEAFDTFEFIPIKPSVATESDGPGSYAGHSRVPLRDRARRPSIDGSGL